MKRTLTKKSNGYIHLVPRYYVRYPKTRTGFNEKQCRYGEVRWDIDINRIALVCLDIWNMDLHQDMAARDDAVTRKKIVPLVNACRQRGLQIIHAPSPPIAHRHPNWVDLVKKHEVPRAEYKNSPVWPPAEFRAGNGPYRQYVMPRKDDMLKAWKLLDQADFHELVQPVGDEPVIATGEELHRLCVQRKILFLLFAGFHTPGCMTNRTYGMTKMQSRGYTCILLRDCTNGMETHKTFKDRLSMKGTIAFLEQTGIYTLSSEQVIKACRE
jgi:hypothetical protein